MSRASMLAACDEQGWRLIQPDLRTRRHVLRAWTADAGPQRMVELDAALLRRLADEIEERDR